MALLSKAPQWTQDDYAVHAERLVAGLLLPAEHLADALAEPLADRLGIAAPATSVSPLEAGDGYLDYTLLTFGLDAATFGPDTWLRIRIGHDTVGFAFGVRWATPSASDRWDLEVPTQVATTAGLAHHPTLSVIGFTPEAQPPVPPPRRPTPFAVPPPPPSPALVGPVGDRAVRIGWHDPLPPTSTLPRFVPFCLDRLSEFAFLVHQVSRLTSGGAA
ncbi:MAG: hypothetical protein O3C27_09875 [Actinomycetota bacterium]|nr:hypothetical protein [Actinomycetota bacterium]